MNPVRDLIKAVSYFLQKNAYGYMDAYIYICIWLYIYIHIYVHIYMHIQYSCLENPMDGGAWWAAVHAVAKSRTRLSNFTLTFHFHALEKEMATNSSILA